MMSDNLERYLDHVMQDRPTPAPALAQGQGHGHEAPTEPEVPSPPNILKGLLRRWYVVVIVAVLGMAVGVPAVWLLVQPGYVATGYIRVAPVIPNILTGEADRGSISNYDAFMNTQALSVTSPMVLMEVADDLKRKGIDPNQTDLLDTAGRMQARLGLLGVHSSTDLLKRAVASGVISVGPVRNTELVGVSVKSMNPEHAKFIVNSLIRRYMSVHAFGATKAEAETMQLLQDERKNLLAKIQRSKDDIRRLAEEYGTIALEGRQDVMAARASSLFGELAKCEADRIGLETDLQILDQNRISTDDLQSMTAARNAFVNADPMVQELTRGIVRLEGEILVATQTLAPENPTVKQQKVLLDLYRARLDEKRKQLTDEFEQGLSGRSDKARLEKRQAMVVAIDRLRAKESRLRQTLSEQDTQSRQIGRTQYDMQELQSQVVLDNQMYDAVSRRIQEIDIDRKQRPRITEHAEADVQRFEDKRVKYSAAVGFMALGLGGLVAFLLDKADKRIQTPEEVTQRMRIPVLGTVTSSHLFNAAALPDQIAADLQAIRTNIGLAGQGIPKLLAVTSATTQEGKTTLAINLATSLVKSGKRVLLVDGDLRRPDVAHTLGVVELAVQAPRVRGDGGFEFAVFAVPASGLDVMVLELPKTQTEVYELIASPGVTVQIRRMAERYDHVIIDTPPVLAFPDGLVWARMAGSAVIASFAGRTTSTDLAEARNRLTQAGAVILGAVISNVSVEHAHHRYVRNYYDGHNGSGRRSWPNRRRMLLPSESGEKGVFVPEQGRD